MRSLMSWRHRRAKLCSTSRGRTRFMPPISMRSSKRHNIRTLVVTGVTTDVCVFTTTTAANDHGYDAVVLSDCVASYSPERHRFALETIQAQGGIFGWVSDSVRVLTTLAPMGDPSKVQIVAERPDTADALRLIEDWRHISLRIMQWKVVTGLAWKS